MNNRVLAMQQIFNEHQATIAEKAIENVMFELQLIADEGVELKIPWAPNFISIEALTNKNLKKSLLDTLRWRQEDFSNRVYACEFFEFDIESSETLLKEDLYLEYHKQILKRFSAFEDSIVPVEQIISRFVERCHFLALVSCMNLNERLMVIQVFNALINAMPKMLEGHGKDYGSCLCLRLCATFIDHLTSDDQYVKSAKHEQFKAICIKKSNSIADSVGAKFIKANNALGWEIVNKGSITTSVLSPEEIETPAKMKIKERYCLLLELGIIDHLHNRFPGLKENSPLKAELIALILELTPEQVKLSVYNENEPGNDNNPRGKNNEKVDKVWKILNGKGFDNNGGNTPKKRGKQSKLV